jgi:hypothetical protein
MQLLPTCRTSGFKMNAVVALCLAAFAPGSTALTTAVCSSARPVCRDALRACFDMSLRQVTQIPCSAFFSLLNATPTGRRHRTTIGRSLAVPLLLLYCKGHLAGWLFWRGIAAAGRRMRQRPLHFTSIYKSQSRPLWCSYGQERMASMPSSTKHTCPRSCPPFAVVGGEA